jgi:hypothetical protein
VARAIMRELQGVTLRSQYPGGMATAGSAGVGSGGGGYNAMYNEPHTRRNSQVRGGTSIWNLHPTCCMGAAIG